MRRLLVLPALGILATCVLAPLGGASGATLTPAEQKWVAPLVTVWNNQNQALTAVVAKATAKNALIAGEYPQNYQLTKTLSALIDCKEPADRIKRAGKPVSVRLTGFRDALNSACIHNLNGANDFAKAISQVGKSNYDGANKLIKSGYAEFKRGSAQLAKAYNSLVALGGPKTFKA
jgi:hypothetical protein